MAQRFDPTKAHLSEEMRIRIQHMAATVRARFNKREGLVKPTSPNLQPADVFVSDENAPAKNVLDALARVIDTDKDDPVDVLLWARSFGLTDQETLLEFIPPADTK